MVYKVQNLIRVFLQFFHLLLKLLHKTELIHFLEFYHYIILVLNIVNDSFNSLTSHSLVKSSFYWLTCSYIFNLWGFTKLFSELACHFSNSLFWRDNNWNHTTTMFSNKMKSRIWISYPLAFSSSFISLLSLHISIF